jgi:hypothetical protein
MTSVAPLRLFLLGASFFAGASSQVIEFESGGLRYQTLTKNGVTIMFAHLPVLIRDYSILQVAVSNGSGRPWLVKPEEFQWQREDGSSLRPAVARNVVNEMLDKAGRSDVIRLVSTYEMGLYGMSRMLSTNGYEQRRQSALAEVTSARLKAAAAASAISFVQTKLAAGESTDGAIFFNTKGKPMGHGKLTIRSGGQVFEFNPSE